ncbi:pyruvate kinase alpha/beta domain-containing protein [Methanolobus psychrotolerans]|uniref:pyruvate kinase alpha/beta domain-containing protein n=1 Tax=Methanolobus psychrotolerans TaxID=1874706 RepID=UPI000B915DD2|nr:pyruvate kinase alpha/beta domain-containing protein [Methanolobus psychrotolerans]
MDKTITYFDNVGKANTEEVMKLSAKRAAELGIKYVVVASTSGETALVAADAFKDLDVKIVAITHQYGLKEPGKWEVDEGKLEKLNELGVIMTTQSHMFSGVERAIQKRISGASRADVISDTLRAVFGKGFKVAIECAMMAADSGYIPVSPDTEIIAIGGTRQGADVALVVRPAHSHEFFSLQVREVIAMPRAKED